MLAVFMLANTLYLSLNRLADALGWDFFAVGETSIPALFQTMILSHTGVGLLLTALMLIFGFGHLPKVWRHYKKPGGISGIAYMLLGVVLTITGLFILTASASRESDESEVGVRSGQDAGLPVLAFVRGIPSVLVHTARCPDMVTVRGDGRSESRRQPESA